MAHTVMVTGADGFIGSHLTEELVKKGEKVKAFCYYNSFNSCGWIDLCSSTERKRAVCMRSKACGAHGTGAYKNKYQQTAGGFFSNFGKNI